MTPPFSPTILKKLRRRLMGWYAQNRRPLPWRDTGNPYRVLVSEFMLQQTQVATAIPYYNDFLRRFPTMERLAAAPESAVLAAWSGLGYYRRARALRETAAVLVREHRGSIPRNTEELKKLPGIGGYTAAALASIVHGERAAVVDGNVIRVVTRLSAWDKPAALAESRRFIEKLAETLLDPASPGDWNQAIMELGARVCTPRSPRCPVCPLSEFCRGRAEDPEAYPVKTRGTTARSVELLVGVVKKNGKVLLVKRADSGLLDDSWEFPGVEREGRPLKEPLARALGALLGRTPKVGSELAQVKHSITNRRITVRAFRVQAPGVRALAGKRQWAQPRDLKILHTSSMTAKLFRRLFDEDFTTD